VFLNQTRKENPFLAAAMNELQNDRNIPQISQQPFRITMPTEGCSSSCLIFAQRRYHHRPFAYSFRERVREREREMWIYIYIHVCVKDCWLCIEVIIGYAKQPKRGGNRPLKPSVSLWEHSLVLSNQSYHSTEETLPNKESWKRLLW
jgi:hypothetical protein